MFLFTQKLKVTESQKDMKRTLIMNHDNQIPISEYILISSNDRQAYILASLVSKSTLTTQTHIHAYGDTFIHERNIHST